MPATPHTRDKDRHTSAPRGLSKEEVHDTLQEEGSVLGAARALDVTRQAIYDWMERHEWENPQTGKVPGSDDE